MKLLKSTCLLPIVAWALLSSPISAHAQSPWAKGCPGVPVSKTGSITWKPALCQEFNGAEGSPDASTWKFDLGGSGWGNREVETYCGPPGYPGNPPGCPANFSASSANSYIDGKGHLLIQAIRRGKTWYSARMKTQGAQNFLYGRIEASVKIPDTANPGLWPAFWWLGSDIAAVPWPRCGEADILENWSPFVLNGPGPSGNRSTIHTAESGGPGITAMYHFPVGGRADGSFNAYGVIWSANMLQFYVTPATTPRASPRPFSIITPSDLSSTDRWPFNASAFLLVNLAVGGTLGGSTAALHSPDVMLVDYIRAYQASAVPAPSLGHPSGITVKAGATTNNTSTLTPGLVAGTGYVYFTCATSAPNATCFIRTDDPLNSHVVNSSAGTPESVRVAVMTTGNSLTSSIFLSPIPTSPAWLIGAALLILAAGLVFVLRMQWGRYASPGAIFGAILFAGLLILAVSAGAMARLSTGSPSPGMGTPPGSYSVTVYAFTEGNAGSGANNTADAGVTIPLRVN